MKKFALIVGGGQGIRMGSDIPKQFLLLNELPVIFHTIAKFSGVADEIVVVLPASHVELFENLRKQYNQNFNVKLVEGGATRQHSVLNGMNAFDGDGFIAIHDAVRPLVSANLVAHIFNEAIAKGNAVPVVAVKESLRKKVESSSVAVNRDEYLIVQTPQCFPINALKAAYNNSGIEGLSDDASVFEKAGHTIFHTEGENSNIKITFLEDLTLAGALMDVSKR